ncbi:MAG: LPS export ABC transporter periplasmic protein LptC [Pelagibacteraceae bacterium]|nr:LPS export ABC transporter periplasmic protein LptC [Pelagibacteraceae bacterium]PHX88950.1 MAG: LPS export ABC transporter periplasmic protein LptC [Pelagibacteraceae bacterium]
MKKNKIVKIFLINLFIIILLIFFFKKILKKPSTIINQNLNFEGPAAKNENSYSSNILENINYTSKDKNGNQYNINALKGEINFSESNVVYLSNVTAKITLKNSNQITITSDFAKYNSDTYDTTFSKNVIVSYLDNNLTGKYLDFLLSKNLMTMSEDVIYTTNKNILNADVIEMNIETKDTKIFMYEEDKKILIKSKS